MDPVMAIVWIGVFVFAATAVITLLYVVGFVPRIEKDNGKLLFKLLITEIVIASVAAFTYFIQSSVHQRYKEDRLPVAKLMVFEQREPVIVKDDGRSLYIRSPDVSRAKRVVDLQIDLKPDFSSSTRASLEAGVPRTISVGNRKYRVSFSQTGTIDADPNEKQGQSVDFAFMSISREK